LRLREIEIEREIERDTTHSHRTRPFHHDLHHHHHHRARRPGRGGTCLCRCVSAVSLAGACSTWQGREVGVAAEAGGSPARTSPDGCHCRPQWRAPSGVAAERRMGLGPSLLLLLLLRRPMLRTDSPAADWGPALPVKKDSVKSVKTGV
jgi:hypothetical protein